MPKKSRRLAARQAELAKKKKLKRSLITRRQRLQSGPQPQESPAEEKGPMSMKSSSESGAPETSVPEPAWEKAMEATATPWRHAYVLSDIRRIGIISAAILLFLFILTFFLR